MVNLAMNFNSFTQKNTVCFCVCNILLVVNYREAPIRKIADDLPGKLLRQDLNLFKNRASHFIV